MSFPISCTACNKTFTISDEIYDKKVAGRVVTIKCKGCGQGIRVDGMKGSGTRAASAPTAASPLPTAPRAGAAAGVAPAPPPVAPAPAPAPTAQAEAAPLWAVDYPDGEDREFTTGEVVAELERGSIERSTLVWREGMDEWLELHQVPELAAELARIEAKKKAAAAAAAKVAPVYKPRAPMPTVTGLGGLPGATRARAPAASPEPPRAKLASTPAIDQDAATPPPGPLPKPRAAQASAPVLPKPSPPSPAVAPPPLAAPPLPPAAPPPPAPAPLAAPPSPPPPLPGPQAAPPAMRPPPVGPADLTPPLPPSVQQAVSRPPLAVPAFPGAAMAPTAAAPFGGTAALATDHASVEFPQAKSKAPLVIGALVVVAAIAAGILALSGGDSAPAPAPTAPAAAPEPATGAAQPATRTTPTSTSGATGSDGIGAETAEGSDPIAAPADPGTTPGAGFAELFAAGARKAESKGASISPSARFDVAMTKAPLAQAASQAQACKQAGGPTGKVTVTVTFDPSGKVSGATITEAPFAGTPTAACITAAMRRAKIEPFSGLPGTVSKTFSIL